MTAVTIQDLRDGLHVNDTDMANKVLKIIKRVEMMLERAFYRTVLYRLNGCSERSKTCLAIIDAVCFLIDGATIELNFEAGNMLLNMHRINKLRFAYGDIFLYL